MNCPVCDEKLREVEKHGVTVDICPGCKGVWLDRGELDRIIEMVQGDEPVPPQAVEAPAAVPQQPQAAPPPQPVRPYRDDDDDDSRRDHRSDDPRYRDGRRKKGGLLGEIFEMFGD